MRIVLVISAAALAVLAGCIVWWLLSDHPDPGVSDREKIKKIMHDLNGAYDSSNNRLDRAIEEQVSLESMRSIADEYVRATRDLAATLPAKGSLQSWKRQTEQYTLEAERFREALAQKRSQLREVFDKLQESCGTCHAAHR